MRAPRSGSIDAHGGVLLYWLRQACRILSAIGGIALALMMLLTVWDVVMRALFNLPLKGVYDLVESTLVLVIFLGIPASFLGEHQIAVDILDSVAGPRGVLWMKFCGAFLSLLFLIVLAWNMIGPASDAYRFDDHKPDFPVPIILLWLVMLTGIAVAILATAFVALRGVLLLAAGRPQR